MDDVTVLIRTKDEEEHINNTLNAIFSQDYNALEVLIVDSGSTDNTLKIARRYPVKIYEIKPEAFTFGYALNYGFERAKGRYVISLSAHALPASNNWITTLISNFDDTRVAAVMSHALPWPDCNPFDRRGLYKKFNIKKQEIAEGSPFIFGNYASAIKKEVWEKIHFDENLPYAEDHDWIKKVRAQGYKIIFEPDAKVFHSHNETLRQIYRRTLKETYALKMLNLENYTLLKITLDMLAGSIYDMGYVLIKRDHIKWFFFAPLRRFVVNYARFKAMNLS